MDAGFSRCAKIRSEAIPMVEAFGSWLLELVSDAARRRFAGTAFGREQERALTEAGVAAVGLTARQLRPGGSVQDVEYLAAVVDQVFQARLPTAPHDDQPTILHALQTGVSAQLAVLGDASLTGTGQSSAQALGLPIERITETLVSNVTQEILARGAGGGPLAPLADQLNHDVTHLQGQHTAGTLTRIVEELVQLTRLRPDGLPGPQVFDVPLADRRSFWGREDLLSTLDGAWGSHRTVALAGLGGVGKSQLAAQFAYRHRGELALVWWVSCTPPAGGELDARALARSWFGALGTYVGLPPADDPESRAAEVRRWLETSARRWLVIFDDAPGWSSIQGMVPQSGSGLSLITSRNRHWDLADRVLDVGVFDVDTAADFLQARSGLDDPAGARTLAQALGGLALALEQAGALLARSPVPLGFADYLDALRRRGLRVFEGGRVDDYDHVVTTVWEESFAAVTVRSPQAAELLELLSVLAPVPVPTHALVAPGGGEALEVAAALEELGRHSLVSATSDAVVVHQLVHRAIAERLSAEHHSTARTRAIALLSHALPDTPDDPTTWEAAAALIPHVTALFSDEAEDTEVLALANRAASHLLAQGDYSSARQLYEDVLAARREVLGERHSQTLATTNNLAEALRAQGELHQARQLQVEVLAANRNTLGERHPDTLTTANNLAGILVSQGDYPSARQLQEEVLAARRDVLGAHHPDTLMAGNNLAATLLAQGELDRARQLQEELLAACQEVLGGRHLHTLTTANNLAATLLAQGELDGARQLLEEVLAARRDVLGERHPHTLATTNNLARTLHAQGELDQARQLQEAVLAANRDTLGERHADTLTTATYLAETLSAQGEHPSARQLQEEVLAASREVLGERHPHTRRAAHSLARILQAQGETNRARQVVEEFGIEPDVT